MLKLAVCKFPGSLKRLNWIALKYLAIIVQENNLFVLRNAAVGFQN